MMPVLIWDAVLDATEPRAIPLSMMLTSTSLWLGHSLATG